MPPAIFRFLVCARKKHTDDRNNLEHFTLLKSKAEIRTTAKSLQKQPNDLELRKSLNEKTKEFRRFTQEKKRNYNKSIFDNMMQFNGQNESKKFWNS